MAAMVATDLLAKSVLLVPGVTRATLALRVLLASLAPVAPRVTMETQVLKALVA